MFPKDKEIKWSIDDILLLTKENEGSFANRAYSGKTDSGIFFSKVQELLIHELAHVRTEPLINSGKVRIYSGSTVSPDQFHGSKEVSRYSDDAVKLAAIILAEFIGIGKSSFFSGGVGTYRTAQVDLVCFESRYQEYAAKHKESGQNVDENRLLSDFLLNISPQVVHEASKQLHKEIFGVDLLLPTRSLIPDSVRKYVTGKYFPAEEKTKQQSHAMTTRFDQAMVISRRVALLAIAGGGVAALQAQQGPTIRSEVLNVLSDGKYLAILEPLASLFTANEVARKAALGKLLEQSDPDGVIIEGIVQVLKYGMRRGLSFDQAKEYLGTQSLHRGKF